MTYVFKSKFKNGKTKVHSGIKSASSRKKYLKKLIARAKKRPSHQRISKKFGGVL